MAASSYRLLLCASFIFLSFSFIYCWDEGDFEIFDAVEEVNQNFYEFLEISPDATTKQVRKAYRKMTLRHHPDKNKEEQSEVLFRNLVTVYEVLKDEDKRKRYNKVLEEGLPDWRQPVFYYRRARKMGLGELFILLSGISTLGQYLTSWAVYLEKKLVVQDVFETKRKREMKKLKKSKGEGDVDDILQEEINTIPKPQLIDLWPILLVKFIFNLIRTSPQRTVLFIEYLKEKYKERQERALELENDDEDDEDDTVIEKRPRKKPELPEYNAELYESISAVSYTPVVSTRHIDDNQIQVKKTDWCEDDTILLAKLVNKFPGGTPKRWQKIAEMMGRQVEEVTCRSKKAKGVYMANLTSVNQVDNVILKGGNISKKGSEISDNIITHGDEDSSLPEENDSISKTNDADNKEGTVPKNVLEKKRHRKLNPEKIEERTKIISQYKTMYENKTSKLEQSENNTSVIKQDDSECWTQNQQMTFEWALRQYPKGTDLRWEKVAEHLPGKTKEDCVTRYKYLAELVKKKKVAS